MKIKLKQANTRRNKAKIRVGVSFSDQRQLRSCYFENVVVAGEQTRRLFDSKMKKNIHTSKYPGFKTKIYGNAE